MPQEIRIWKIENKINLKEIIRSKLDLEERIESWIEKDISIISSELLVIGRQVETDFGGVVDILCIDPIGDLVIIELKRDKTPREITSQILDYASWIKDLSNDQVTDIASKYISENISLDVAFKDKFEHDLPEVLNENHKMIVVGSEIDNSTERIIRYLSESYGVGINAVTFQYFSGTHDMEFVANVFLIDPIQVEYSSKDRSKSKRKPNPTYEELVQEAEGNDVKELFDLLTKGLNEIFDYRSTTKNTVAYIGLIDGKRQTIFHVIPGETDSVRMASIQKNNVLYFQFYVERLSNYLGISETEITNLLTNELKDYYPWATAQKCFVGFFKDTEEIQVFTSKLSFIKAKTKKDG